MTPLQSIFKRERLIVLSGLALLTGFAWIYIWRGAGMGMTALQMTRLALFPHQLDESMQGMEPPPISYATVVFMWWIMMGAMMTPSATPLVLLYGRVMRHARTQGQTTNVFGEAFLIAGYLLVWLAFSALAGAIQIGLQHLGLLSNMMLWSHSKALSAIVLAAAGVYQFSPLKRACLNHCRGPVDFLAKHMRQANGGAFVMGGQHGIWCVGCCWTLMALLFVGGVMNLVWIGILAMLVLIEKVAPAGMTAGRIVGGLLIAWSIATLAV